jgi:hypothetical protein
LLPATILKGWETMLSRPFSLCAEHVRQFGGGSPLPNLMEGRTGW